MSERTARRRVKPVQTYNPSLTHSQSDTFLSAEEEKLMKQAIENSKRLTRLAADDGDSGIMKIPFAPTFFPTVEEFEGNPLHYIEKIRGVAQQYGICKIVPPKGWNPPFCVDMKSKKKFQTKEQLLHRIQEGVSFGDGEEYSAYDYLKMSIENTKEWIKENAIDKGNDGDFEGSSDGDSDTDGGEKRGRRAKGPGGTSDQVTLEYLEKTYWDLVEKANEEYIVEYGNDVDSHEFGSGFPRSERGRGVEDDYEDKDDDMDLNNSKSPKPVDKAADSLPEPKFGTEEFYKETYWNLNNIPNCPDSILKHIKVGINGINVPWMYFGNLFSTFCWHNEDNYLYSINYHHWGAPKVWYGVPGTERDASGLEQVFKSYLSMKMREVPDLLHHITTMFSPRLLQNEKVPVPVYKIIQHAGEFVITFPMAFHGGFSMGPNTGEAVNFATHDWISHGAAASERYRSFARPAVFSQDRLTFTMANHLEDQKSYQNCIMLRDELDRVIKEEMDLRTKLFNAGVRDVSGKVKLPQNRLDQLDEESADYDDKRLCHTCKHICYFSCVACECSRKKVSCLRHARFMCRCEIGKRYMMIWSTADEMYKTFDEVKERAEKLKEKMEGAENESTAKCNKILHGLNNFPAPGVAEDARRHRGYKIDLRDTSPLCQIPKEGQLLRDIMNFSKRSRSDIPEKDGGLEKKSKTDNNDNANSKSNDDEILRSGKESVADDKEKEIASSKEVAEAPVSGVDAIERGDGSS